MEKTSILYHDNNKSRHFFQKKVEEIYNDSEIGYIIGGSIDNLEEEIKNCFTLQDIETIADYYFDNLDDNSSVEYRRSTIYYYCVNTFYYINNKFINKATIKKPYISKLVKKNSLHLDSEELTETIEKTCNAMSRDDYEVISINTVSDGVVVTAKYIGEININKS